MEVWKFVGLASLSVLIMQIYCIQSLIQEIEIQITMQQSQMHRFFQSIHILPFQPSPSLTASQLDQKILQQSSNLYSLFDLIVFIKDGQQVSDCPEVYYRRLMILLCGICQGHQLYYSKVKALGSFWWTACLAMRREKQNDQRVDGIDRYRESIFRHQFLYLSLRSFQILIRNYGFLERSSTLHQNQLLKQNIEEIVTIVKSQLLDHREESEYKIRLCLQYAQFLLLVFNLRKQPSCSNIEPLFLEFCQALTLILRSLKKFYTPAMPYRKTFLFLLTKARTIFSPHIPSQKINLLTGIINYMNRKEYHRQEAFVDVHGREGKDCVRAAMRVFGEWKRVLAQREQLDGFGLTNQDKTRFKSHNNKIVKPAKILSALKPIEPQLITVRRIKQLKRKRSLSLQIPKQDQSFNLASQWHPRPIQSKIRHRIYSAVNKNSRPSQKNIPIARKQNVNWLASSNLKQNRKGPVKPLKLVIRKK